MHSLLLFGEGKKTKKLVASKLPYALILFFVSSNLYQHVNINEKKIVFWFSLTLRVISKLKINFLNN